MFDFLKRYGIECILALVVFTAAAWFYNGANWNHISRYDMVFSFVEPGTPDTFSFRIDRFLVDPAIGVNTGDWARNPRHGPHYYSNKAPGPALLAIPVYFLLFHTQGLLNAPSTAAWMTIVNCYVINLAVTVLPVAFSAPLFFWFMLRLTKMMGWSVLLTLGLYLGTLAFPFSTQLWGHATAMAFVVICLYTFHEDSPKALFWSGMAGGMAVLSEYSCVLTVFSLLVVLMVRRNWRHLAWFIAGGFPILLIFMGYHWICFGSPFTIASFHNNELFQADAAAGGLFYLETIWAALWGLSFSPFRGLFYYMPLLLLAVWALGGMPRLWRDAWFWIGITNLIAFFVMNVMFNGWHGGASTGPRYQIPVLPLYFCLIALGLREILPRLASLTWPRLALNTVSMALMIVSFSNMMIVASVSPMAALPVARSQGELRPWRNPLRYYYRIFNRGRLQPHHLEPIRVPWEPGEPHPRRAFILGDFLGLEGRGAVAPLIAFLFAAGAGLAVLVRIAPRTRQMIEKRAAPEPEDRSNG